MSTDHEEKAKLVVDQWHSSYGEPLLDGEKDDLIKAVAAALAEATNPRNCPKCESPSPRLHPAMQHEGEVQECNHSFHAVADRDRLNKEVADLRAKLAEAERERGELRPIADAYNRVCQSLGIKNDILGYIKAERDADVAKLAEVERERDRLKVDRSALSERAQQIEDEHNAAFVRGMERALDPAEKLEGYVIHSMDGCGMTTGGVYKCVCGLKEAQDAIHAIAAEIAKAETQ